MKRQISLTGKALPVNCLVQIYLDQTVQSLAEQALPVEPPKQAPQNGNRKTPLPKGAVMGPQVDKAIFKQALVELGHDPANFEGKRLSLHGMCELYELDQDFVLSAIDQKEIAAHYDYFNDTIWVDALDAAHFYYCLLSQQQIF